MSWNHHICVHSHIPVMHGGPTRGFHAEIKIKYIQCCKTTLFYDSEAKEKKTLLDNVTNNI